MKKRHKTFWKTLKMKHTKMMNKDETANDGTKNTMNTITRRKPDVQKSWEIMKTNRNMKHGWHSRQGGLGKA